MHNPPRPQCKFVKTVLQQKSPRAVFPNFIELFLQASLVVAVLVLLYCLYVVQDWLDMLTHDQVNIIQNLEPYHKHFLSPPASSIFSQGVKKKLAAMGRSGTGGREGGGEPAPAPAAITSPPPQPTSTTPSASTTLASPAPLTSSPPLQHASVPLPSAPPPPSSGSVNSSQRSRPLPKTVITRQPITGAPVPQTSL